MTSEVFEYVRALGLTGKTLEVGSRDVNGSVKRLFTDYTGIDRIQGQNVDIVADGHDIPFPDETFDNVLCLETLEHDDAFLLTAGECRRVLKKGGSLVITVPGIGFPKHDYPKDYWRFTQDGLMLLFYGMSKIVIYDKGTVLYGCGIKT